MSATTVDPLLVNRGAMSRDRGAEPRANIAVAVIADDALSGEAVVANLSSLSGVRHVPADQIGRADVVVVVALNVSERLLARMEALRESASNSKQCIVLVGDLDRERLLARAFRCGVVSFIPRESATGPEIGRAIVASGSGRAVLPARVTRWLVDRSREFEHVIAEDYGVVAGGLAAREIQVIKLLAKGMSTAEIAAELAYAERTIKNIIHDLLSRLKMRNRTEAVAYAYRIGAL